MTYLKGFICRSVISAIDRCVSAGLACFFRKRKFGSDGIILSSTTSNVCGYESLSKWKVTKSISWRNPVGICGQRLRYLCYSTGSCSKGLWRPAIQHINSSLCWKHALLSETQPCLTFFIWTGLLSQTEPLWRTVAAWEMCMFFKLVVFFRLVLHVKCVFLRHVVECLLTCLCRHQPD